MSASSWTSASRRKRPKGLREIRGQAAGLLANGAYLEETESEAAALLGAERKLQGGCYALLASARLKNA